MSVNISAAITSGARSTDAIIRFSGTFCALKASELPSSLVFCGDLRVLAGVLPARENL